MIALFFLLDERKVRTRLEVVLSEAVRTELMRTNTNSCGILTFAILLHLSLVLDEGKPLGENHQKLANPAEYVKVGAKRRHSEQSARCQRQGAIGDQSADLMPLMNRAWLVMIATQGRD
jgi:hypothetical protein